MPLIRKHLLGLIVISRATGYPTTSYALSCKLAPSMEPTMKEPLGTALAVPADAPDGTIIWESAPHSIPVICADDYETGIREDIYFYINPAKADIGKGIRLGVRYKSQTITQSSGTSPLASTRFRAVTGRTARAGTRPGSP